MSWDTFVVIVGSIIKNSLYQLIFTVGLVAVVGLIIGLLNKVFFRLAGYKVGRIVGLTTGFIGVPIHEIGHALFCVIFRHRIIEVKLYQLNNAEGTLGYVNHAYNRRSLYQQIGNFFIGFGPILFGSMLLLLLMFWLVPNLFGAFNSSVDFSRILNLDLLSLSTLTSVFDLMRSTKATFFAFSEFGYWRWWAFMVPACSIALHMSLSVPDIKSSWVGFCFIVAAVFIANAVLHFFANDAISTLTNHSLAAGAFVLNFLTIAVVFSLILVLIGLIIRVIFMLARNKVACYKGIL